MITTLVVGYLVVGVLYALGKDSAEDDASVRIVAGIIIAILWPAFALVRLCNRHDPFGK